VEQPGWLNAVRLITKNLLATSVAPPTSVEWLMSYLVVPLGAPLYADRGSTVRVTFAYRPGDEIHVLTDSVRAAAVPGSVGPR
jgi:hypothetical protein